jgi:zinc transport system ATP-binding protein
MKPIIKLDEVFFTYQDSIVLENVSLEIFPGEFVAIIGPNGGGKTTLLKLILGFLKPFLGKVEVFGSVQKNNHAIPIAYVPQTTRFDRQFPISVMEVVLSGCLSHLPWYGRFHRTEQEAAAAALEKVGLSDFQQTPFGKLSGGQAQRVLIARALVSNPQLLLLDEPTASVDSQAEAEIYAILQKLHGSMTILMVTHDLKAAVSQVDRVLCIQRQAVEMKPEDVCAHFAIGLYHPPLSPQRQK